MTQQSLTNTIFFYKEGVSLCQNFMFYITHFTVGLLLYSNVFTRLGSNL